MKSAKARGTCSRIVVSPIIVYTIYIYSNMDLYSGDIHFLFIDSYIPNARRSSFREEVFFGLQIKST